MTRQVYIELIRRQIYGGQPNDDAEITIQLVNKWLDFGIAFAAQKNYIDSVKLDGIAYVNNSFYTTYKALEVTQDEQFLWKIELPHIPFGLGATEGVSQLKFKDSASNQLSYPVVWLTMNQLSYQRGMRTIPNKLLAYSEGTYIYVMSTIILSQYTAQATMVSGGSGSDLSSVINVPDNYMVDVTEYIKQQLNFERNQPVDLAAGDGQDAIKST